ncbi:MAG: Arc family DNA-binding protein [Verrucomicrobiae bacterium]|nr:Arc family DNA-binding protein [Verrucomicrobiae bacterium]
MKQTSKKSFLLRIDSELYNTITEIAKKDCRSVNSEIEFILKRAVSERQNSSKMRKESEEKVAASDRQKEQEKTEPKHINNQEIGNVSNWIGTDNIPD